ncbi:hypothetical protein FQR65_LT05591 [Abscondita terminalis]|nr:hypothetical protein FQR65_LT05591 [Abscondita terminalis]
MESYFSAVLTDFKMLYNVLKAITFKEYAVLRPMEEGLKVTIEEMKCVETSAYIPVQMFTSYSVHPKEEVKFKLNLKILTESLFIYGDDANLSLKLEYKGPGHPLCLIIKHNEEDITVECQIYTMDVDESTEFLCLADECALNKVVVNASQFLDMLTDLDARSDDLELNLSPNPPYFRISTTSTMGESQTDISKHSEMVLLFQCDQIFQAKYAFNYIKQILKGNAKYPLLVGEGCSVYCPGQQATEDDIKLVKKIFQTSGICELVPESLISAAGALAGSGPAFIYIIIEALSDGGVKLGIPRQTATTFAAQTVLGAAKMVLETKRHTGALKEEVTSPGGTTIAGIHALERGCLRGTLIDALEASAQRSIEMAKKNSNNK